ncbi:SRPBCC family protein [Flavihumibacter petaseus]|uniref:Activator of Hsp90 ATPase homologue 1/2-like C-terminal domain-containing protein n=1 Tax=Flavihumibacter petaseus NBRC 106054 TaxID=1220578 RepID=A0A0E9MYW7_9BACT|nr:SRPBCC family protein [Flavihumibacter petaseus]GAO42596.1 hypothetical protein FPE01S_01_16110 [Flavihumibacter petaseus NBRC 106054]
MLGQIIKTSESDWQVRYERILPHPIHDVWTTITHPDLMQYWFTDIDMDFREGGTIKIYFRDQDKTLSTATILNIQAPNQFSYNWEGEQAVWDLVQIDSATTQLTLTYSKLSTEMVKRVPAGWHALLDRLDATLNGQRMRYPFGAEQDNAVLQQLQVRYANQLSEQYPDQESGKSVVLEKVFDAAPGKIWKALTDKGEMRKWYFDLSDFRAEPGFQFSFPGQGAKGEQYMHRCEVLEAVPERRLRYSWAYDGHRGYSVLTFLLKPEGGGTRLRLTHRGLETFPDGPDFQRESFQAGWTELITKHLDIYLKEN